ncbi:unnamed protein product [Cylicocyclus nassatus]|uniref:Uncharacterized protein n=1 Tax=Cylicocyclus nassatus TaxID=53992 RepID=A0AA36HDH6_CYLNA|nr:unnamed protein product [Cylicocyclus nassatus]
MQLRTLFLSAATVAAASQKLTSISTTRNTTKIMSPLSHFGTARVKDHTCHGSLFQHIL